VKDLYWVSAAGREMQPEDWSTGWVDTLGMLLIGEEIGELDDRGEPIVGASYLLLLNGAANGVNFIIPERLAKLRLQPIIDTNAASPAGQPITESYPLASHSAAIIQVSRP